MSFRKFASVAILDAQMGNDAGFAKSAHRAVFDYEPREGYLYVRSRAISSRCNDNFDMFPADEIEKSYLSFIGKPVFVNHHNDDHRRARGVILDAALHKDRNPDGSPDTWAEVLMEVDAVRFPRLAKAILAGEVDRTSMGCDVQLSKCSVCGNEATSPLQYCAHIPGKKGKKIYKLDPYTGQKKAQLVFEICSGLSFFENSLLVEAPADPTAYFLGSVVAGPGLEHLTAGLNKTASKKTAAVPHPYTTLHHPDQTSDSAPGQPIRAFCDKCGPVAANTNYDLIRAIAEDHQNQHWVEAHDDKFGQGAHERDFPHLYASRKYRQGRDGSTHWTNYCEAPGCRKQISDENYDDSDWVTELDNNEEHHEFCSEPHALQHMDANPHLWDHTGENWDHPTLNTVHDMYKRIVKRGSAPEKPETRDYRLIGENEARGDSRPVTEEEFHEIAGRGRKRYQKMMRNRQRTDGLEQHWDDVKRHAFQATREPWGGATYNTRTGLPIRSEADIYSLSVRPHGEKPTSVAPDAPEHEFHSAMDEARNRYSDLLSRRGHHLGVFHDVDEHRIDIDPVVLTDTHKGVEELGAYKGAVGGAYHFKSGDGFWPPHVKGLRTQGSLHPYAWNPEGRTIPYSYQEGAAYNRENFPYTYMMHDTQPLNVWALLKQAATEPNRSAAQEGVENDHVRGFEGRDVPDTGHAVSVYRDLSGAPKSGYPARGSWSIKRQRKNGSPDSHVVAHTVGLHVTDAEPRFYEAARQHFKEQEKRGVHAFINGHVSHYDHPLGPGEKPEGEGWRQVSYYPDISHFFLKDTRNKYHGSDEAAFRGGFMWARGNIKEGDDGPVPQSKFEQPRTSVWQMISEAAATGDDLFDWDFLVTSANSWVDDNTGLRVTAATNDETDDWHRDHRSHPKNLVDLFNFAVDHNYHKDLPKMDDHQSAVHHGMTWYPGMHAVGESLVHSAHPSLKKNAEGKEDHNLLRHRVYGAMAVYSEGTDVPMNYHQASLATAKGRPLWSKDTGMSEDEQVHEFGRVKDTQKDSPTKGQMVPGKPKSMESQAQKVGLLFSPNLNHMHEVVKAAKTANYGALGMHGGDEPGTEHGIDQILSGHGKGGRVVIDRHALSAAIGHRIDGVDFNRAGLSKYQKPTKANPGALSHLHTEYGNDENKHYSYVADAYRVAAAHLSQHHGREITPQQVQAVTWGARKHLNDSGIQHVPSLPAKKSSWKSHDENLWNGVVNAKHSWINASDNENIDRTRSFKDRPNTRNINNWEHHLDSRPSIGEPIMQHFDGNGRGHWGKKLAYGETKSPEDVDTLRSENCTVCGNSSAWDGTQCQVCGYTAPPRPFGDPDTDLAKSKDIRKQVLDGTIADPNDPDQQLGQQLGDPEEVADQEEEAAAGEDSQMGTLTCNVCGTGVQPAPPTTDSEEPPYPADGDVCPVCKKGQLLSEAEGAPMPGDEAEMDSAAAEEGQEGDAPGGASQQEAEEDDGDEAADEEFKGQQDGSDDDDQDDEDSFDPKKKADKNQKASAFVPVWWKPSWWRS